MRNLTILPEAATNSPMTELVAKLSRELVGVFQITDVWFTPRRSTVTFAGIPLIDPDACYDEIALRFQPYGFTPILRQNKDEIWLIAAKTPGRRIRTGNPIVNGGLLIATIATTLDAGANLAGTSILQPILAGGWLAVLQGVWLGAPFAIALLTILGIHELGHYLAARRHKVAATLPYFIPMPFTGIGTMGAFIALKSPMKNRKALFDIGIAGPIAGLLVAFPLLIAGIYLSDVVSVSRNFYNPLTLRNAGESILVRVLVALVKPTDPGMTLAMHPVFFAAWLGMLITGINLLPAGQLDGGHIAYAMLGKWAHRVAILVFCALLVAGIFLNSWNWLVWAFFIMVGGLRHPPPLNDIHSLDSARKIVGWSAFLLLILLVVPQPFS